MLELEFRGQSHFNHMLVKDGSFSFSLHTVTEYLLVGSCLGDQLVCQPH